MEGWGGLAARMAAGDKRGWFRRLLVAEEVRRALVDAGVAAVDRRVWWARVLVTEEGPWYCSCGRGPSSSRRDAWEEPSCESVLCIGFL